MKTLFVLFMVMALVMNTGAPLIAQSNDPVLCSVCQQPNEPKNNFCTSCGVKFVALATRPAEESRPVSYRQPARLFSIPTAQVLPELQFGVTLGNAFGLEVGESFLGTMGLGIGDIAEIELSTAGLITGLAAGTTGMKTAGLKMKFFESEELGLIVGASLRNSNDWERENRTERVLAVAAPDDYAMGLRGLNYESRITTLSLSVSKQVREQTTLHAGLGYSDIRYRNVYSYFVNSPSIYAPSEERRGQWQAFGGAVIVMSERTKIMGEVQSLPFFKYSVNRGEIRLSHMYVAAAGLRFSISQSWSLDSGVRYQSNFIGLADTQIRITINGVFSLR